MGRREVEGFILLNEPDFVTVCEHLQCKGLSFLGEATPGFQTWMLNCLWGGCARPRLVCPHAFMPVCTVCGHTMGLARAIPRHSTAQFEKILAAAECGISLLTARCGQPVPTCKALKNDLDFCSKALGEGSLPCPWPGWPHWPTSWGWSLRPLVVL